MPINTEGLRASLKEKIKQALDAPIDNKSNSDTVKQNLANSIADAIADGVDAWIKTATVTVAAGIPVQVAPTSGTGATSSTGQGTIS